MSAKAAWLELRLQLVEAIDTGRPVPCVIDPDPFTSEERAERREAAAACSPCPVLIECARFALVNDEQANVWGSVDLTPRPGTGGGRKARRAELVALIKGDSPNPPVAQPAPLVRACAECGVEFTPSRKPARYCSGACRSRVSRRTRKAKGGGPDLQQETLETAAVQILLSPDLGGGRSQ